MATTADTSQASLKYIPETTWGVTPGSGNMKSLRFTGESLSIEKSTTISEEINDADQIADLIATGIKAAGDVNGEVSYGAYDDLIESALRNTWGSDISSSVTGVAVNSTGKIVYPSGSLPSFQIGQAIRISGFVNASNNRTVVVTAVTTSTRVVTVTPSLAQESASAGAVEVKGTPIVNGSDIKSFTFEKEFGDVNKFLVYTGMVVDTMSISVEADEKITTSFTFMGKNGTNSSSTSNPGSLTPATTNDVMNGSTENMIVIENGVVIGYVKSVSVESANGLREKPIIAQIDASGVSKSRFQVTGNLMLYFTDFSIYDKFKANSSSSLAFSILDSSGEYVVYLPRVKFSEAKIVAGGPDQDVIVEGSYQALHDSTTGKTMVVTRIS